MQLAYTGEREYLKATRVGKNRAVPCVELMQSASLAQCVKSGTEVQVVGVAQYYLCLYLLAQLLKVYSLDRANGSHGHKDRGLYLSVIGGYESGTCVAARVGML